MLDQNNKELVNLIDDFGNPIISASILSKSTIFNLITGLVNPRSGVIKITGEDVTNYPIYLRTNKFKVGYVPQYGGCQELISIYSHRQWKLNARGLWYGGRL